jgi:hypothetical protein
MLTRVNKIDERVKKNTFHSSFVTKIKIEKKNRKGRKIRK